MRRHRWTLLLAGLGLWVASWLGNRGTDEGNAASLGLTEGEWRALLNPALVLLILGVLGFGRRTAGVAILVAGLALVLAGNVVEFGLWGDGIAVDAGWLVFLLGTVVALAGLAVLAVTPLARRVAV